MREARMMSEEVATSLLGKKTAKHYYMSLSDHLNRFECGNKSTPGTEAPQTAVRFEMDARI